VVESPLSLATLTGRSARSIDLNAVVKVRVAMGQKHLLAAGNPDKAAPSRAIGSDGDSSQPKQAPIKRGSPRGFEHLVSPFPDFLLLPREGVLSQGRRGTRAAGGRTSEGACVESLLTAHNNLPLRHLHRSTFPASLGSGGAWNPQVPRRGFGVAMRSTALQATSNLRRGVELPAGFEYYLELRSRARHDPSPEVTIPSYSGPWPPMIEIADGIAE
jgi:hypothetical protein